jgi:hypothetical protein
MPYNLPVDLKFQMYFWNEIGMCGSGNTAHYLKDWNLDMRKVLHLVYTRKLFLDFAAWKKNLFSRSDSTYLGKSFVTYIEITFSIRLFFRC